MIGDRIPRYDGVPHVTGSTQYIDDLRFPGMLFVRPLLSPHPNARIVRISTARALEHPGVRLVLTSPDIPKNRYGYANDHFVLADGYVRYVGQPVAAVVAYDEGSAEEALSLIEVDYEPLEPVFDPLEAMKKGSPWIRDHGNVIQFGEYDRRVIRLGDIEKGFREADFIFEDTLTTQVQAHAFLETHGGVATFDDQGRILVYSTGQSVHWIHPLLSDVLQLPRSKVRVAGGNVGGAFGGKSDLSVEPIVAVAALKTGRPVKWRWTMKEELRLPTSQGGFVMYYKTGVKKDGTITARYVRTIEDIGAFDYRGNKSLDRHGNAARGPYRIPNYWFDGYAVHTNKVPGAALRGFAVGPSTFACEIHMDRIAKRMGLGPIEFRLINALTDGDVNGTGQVLDSVSVKECLEAVTPLFHSPTLDPPASHLKRGRGVALAIMPMGVTGGAPSATVNVYVTLEGTVSLVVSTVDLGQGVRTVLAQIVSEVLGIPENWVTVTKSDSSQHPTGAGPGASQETYVTGNALLRAVEEIRNLCLDVAAARLKTEKEELFLEKGSVVSKSTGVKMTLKELSAEALVQGRSLAASGVYQPKIVVPDKETGLGAPYEEYSYAATGAEVLVDEETGSVSVERLVSAADAGRAINPMAVEGQIQGGAAMNLGFALMEELYPAYPDGASMASGLNEYLIPTSLDVPLIEAIVIEKPSLRGPFGAKGIGEITATMAAPAIVNAVADAVGVSPDSLPITAERLLALMKQKGSREKG
jgi:CO/xanthine dehydrogenase Mo-binding subunit